MNRKTLIGLFACCLLLVSGLIADWQPGDGHKMHFPQLPDETGWAVNATQPLILADDWECSETGWVKDVHFWGAWKGGIEGEIDYFVLSFHEDIPADQSQTGYSMPGATLAEVEVFEFALVPIDPPTMEGWYDPQTGEYIIDDHQAYFQYNVLLPEADWFFQDAGTIYWLNISAVMVAGGPDATWGWKSTLDHWNDDAVWATWGNLSWIEMYEPVNDPLINDFQIIVDPTGQFIGGGGAGSFGEGWYFYPQEDWWNIWFYDHPFTYENKKVIHVEFDAFPVDPGAPRWLEFAVNWSTDQWSLDQPASDSTPPLPGVDEALYIGRAILLADDNFEGHYSFDFEILDYNPEWVSIDVRGFNFDIPLGIINHDCLPSLDLSFVITGGPAETDTCEFYKSGYLDYSPNGMPDFDQKQGTWWNAATGNFSWCGPVALANCLWWFDSKFETSPIDPRPFWPSAATPPLNDNYPLIQSYDPAGLWDDHDTLNVVPLINQLAAICNTDGFQPGTSMPDLDAGVHTWLANNGISGAFSTYVTLGPSFNEIKDSIISCQDVIMLLGFYEEIPGGPCNWLGGHYVTGAGVCTEATRVCISDPFFDSNEGEPPPGTVHGSTVHNDASLVSGPHGSIHHDAYNMALISHNCNSPATWEFTDYPNQWLTDGIFTFEGQNPLDPGTDPNPYQGGTIRVLLEAALIICPTDTCLGQLPGDVNSDGAIDIADAAYLVSYLYGGGPAPLTMANADPNGDCCIDYKDILYLIDYGLHGGPAPVDCTCQNPVVCIPDPPDYTPGKVRHSMDLYIPADGSPVGHMWNELWPNYGDQLRIDSWNDDGDGILTKRDSLDFFSILYNSHWPAYVEEVTTTLTLAKVGTNDTIYVDLIHPPDPTLDPRTVPAPVGTFWHEVSPKYNYRHLIVWWNNYTMPALADGDIVMLQALNGPDSGRASNYQVADIATDLIISPLPIEGDEYDHNLDGYRPYFGTSPVGTVWKELWPVYNNISWVLDEWRDNGTALFDYGDTIMFRNEDEPNDTILKRVEQVMPTIKTLHGSDTIWFDYMCGNPHVDDMYNLVNTYWMQVVPFTQKRYICQVFLDNGNGKLDFCDFLELMSISAPDSGTLITVHVEDYGTDIVANVIDFSCCQLRGDVNHDGSRNITDLTYLVDWMFRGGPPPICMEEADVNGDGAVNITDLTYLVDWMFRGGPPPVPC